MKLRIESDGTTAGTAVLTEDGSMIEGVAAIVWAIDAKEGVGELVLYMRRVPVTTTVDRIMREDYDARLDAQDEYHQMRAQRLREEARDRHEEQEYRKR